MIYLEDIQDPISLSGRVSIDEHLSNSDRITDIDKFYSKTYTVGDIVIVENANEVNKYFAPSPLYMINKYLHQDEDN